MLEEKELTAAAPSVALRDEEGAVRADFVERVQQASPSCVPSWSG
jgi:hypothetical protein